MADSMFNQKSDLVRIEFRRSRPRFFSFLLPMEAAEPTEVTLTREAWVVAVPDRQQEFVLTLLQKSRDVEEHIEIEFENGVSTLTCM